MALETNMRVQNRIFLVGMMGAGKSTVGRLLATKLGFQLTDTDQMIESRTGKAISDIFEQEGEAQFRLMEHDLYIDVSTANSVVIATGGGFPCHNDLMVNMLRDGTVVYLKGDAESLFQRIQGNPETRPMLGTDPEAYLKTIKTLIISREPIYAQAHITIEISGKEADSVAVEISERLSQ